LVCVIIALAACAPPQANLEVDIDTGRLQGAMIEDVTAFKGIPYAN
jgi:hypothetical protein